MKKSIIYFIIFLIAIINNGCELLGDKDENYQEPAGWFTVLSNSLVNFDDGESFQEFGVYGLHFLDENKGWAIGSISRDGPDKTVIASTTDGGKNWKFNFMENYHGGDPYFFNMETGILAGNVIHRTTDAGETWTHRIIRPGEPAVGVTEVNFQNESIGWATGPFGAIAKTTDSGITWNYLDLGYEEERFGSISISGNNVWILGEIDPGRLIKTSNGGESWQTIPLPSREEGDSFVRFNEVHFMDEYHGWLVGSYRHIFYTSDGGNTWTLQYPQTQDQIDSDAIFSIDSHEGLNALALTSAGAILSTKNGGQSWEILMKRNNNSVNSTIQFMNENVAYAIQEKKLIKTVTRGEQ